MTICVLPGTELVFASPLRFSRELIRLDLPTLDLPAKATSGNKGGGNLREETALWTKSADTIFIAGAKPMYFAKYRNGAVYCLNCVWSHSAGTPIFHAK